MDTLEFNTKSKELENQLKELLAKYPNQRVDFEFNDDYECYWKDTCYSDGDFGIFNGHNWYCEDRCTVRSIYINDDDDLSFDLSYIAYDHEGNRQEDEELEDVTLDYIIEVTRSSDWDFILSQLNFFAEILIVSPTEESSADVEHKKYCPECGTEVKPEQKFCTECGTRLIESETLAPQPKAEHKSEPVKVITISEKIQDYCDKIKARLEELEMTEFVVFGNDFDGSYDGEDPILPDDVDVYELFEFCVPDMYGELRYEDYWELIRKVRIENGNILFEVGAYCTFDGEENWCLHENFTKDDLVNEYSEKAVESHLCNLLIAFEDDDTLNLNKMIVPQPKSNEKNKKKSESTTSKKQKVTFQDLDGALILVSFDAVNPEDGDEANHGAIPYRFENGKLLHYNLDDVDVTEVDSSFNTDECKVRMRMPYDVDDYTSMDEFADEVIDDVAPDFIEELKNIDVEVVDNEFTFAIYNKNGDEVYSYTKVVSGDADDEGDLFSWDDDEEEDKPVAPPKKEKPSKKKSEPKPDKELDKKLNDLYKMAVACRIGKNGVERSEVLAMDYYQEYLEEAPTSHSKYLDAHYGMAELCTKMGDEGHSLGMDEDALDWYNEAVEHYEEIVKYPKKPFNDRLLAEVAYDKLRKKIAKLK